MAGNTPTEHACMLQSICVFRRVQYTAVKPVAHSVAALGRSWLVVGVHVRIPGAHLDFQAGAAVMLPSQLCDEVLSWIGDEQMFGLGIRRDSAAVVATDSCICTSSLL